jgi:Rrf2 family protein
MLKLSRKADYGLVALKALGGLPAGESLSARELAERFHLPLDLTPKVMAKLVTAGMVEASMGKMGGYRLAREPSLITVAEVVRILDGEQHIAPCQQGDLMGQCSRLEGCEIKSPLDTLNDAVMKVLDTMTLAQL